MFASVVFLILAAASPALGTLYMTSPVASSSWTAGQQATISWEDDGQAPTLKDLGPCKLSVYVGSQIQQTLIQEIVPSVDVSTTNSVVFTPDASKGENSNQYFIRVESLSLKDSANTAYPALAFSAKFAMGGMTGAFTADAKAQIAAGEASTAASAAPATTSSAASATSNTATSKASTTSHAPSTTASAKAATGSNGAASLSGSAIGLAGAVAVAFSMLF